MQSNQLSGVTVSGKGKPLTIHLHAIPEEGVFKPSRFHIAKNNVRPRWYRGQEQDDGDAGSGMENEAFFIMCVCKNLWEFVCSGCVCVSVCQLCVDIVLVCIYVCDFELYMFVCLSICVGLSMCTVCIYIYIIICVNESVIMCVCDCVSVCVD